MTRVGQALRFVAQDRHDIITWASLVLIGLGVSRETSPGWALVVVGACLWLADRFGVRR